MSLDWGVDVARLSLFLSEPYPISDKDWTIVTGQEEAGTRQVVPGGKRLRAHPGSLDSRRGVCGSKPP